MKIRDLILTAMFAALTAIGAFIHFQFLFATITLQFFFTAMAGVLLGRKYGAVSQAVYVLLGLVGLPIFANGGGFSYVLQPTFGFLVGLIPAAWVIGRLTEKKQTVWAIALACLAGLGVLYLVGMPYIAVILNGYMGKGLAASKLFMMAMIPYLPGDCLKIVVTALLGSRLCPLLRKQMARQTA
jgi:biotin transport system substrate-specific component